MNIKALVLIQLVGLVGGVACTAAEPKTTSPGAVVESTTTTTTTTVKVEAVSYASCDEVEAAGKAPLHKGEPGYSSKLDRDGDGTACDVEKMSLRVSGLDEKACDDYAAKQTRLNPGSKAWTSKVDGTDCVVTEG